MMTTQKLFETDSYLKEFTASVLSCEAVKNGFAVVLDRTAFYPEGGGQPCDLGVLGGARVLDVQEKDGVIVHTVDAPLAGTVAGTIDWARRFDLMQQHSGEHMISGTAHRLYGVENVGFHMGAELITIDFDRVVSMEELLTVEADGDSIASSPFALNEIAILKHDNSSMISINTSVDGSYLATYLADGLVISTPTGSTGYSLSVGGPIISPDSKTIVLSPIAAHSLAVRPIILNDNVKIELHVQSRSHNFMLAIDGRSESLYEGTALTIQAAPYKLKIVRRADHSFFDTLRSKLLWGADKR